MNAYVIFFDNQIAAISHSYCFCWLPLSA